MAEIVVTVVKFAFNIGDVVQHKLEDGNRADRLLVIGRTYEECPGGGQKHYTCRGGIWNKDTYRFHEEELSPYTAQREKSYNEKAGEDQQRFSDKMEGKV
jgi:hypothetical protein